VKAVAWKRFAFPDSTRRTQINKDELECSLNDSGGLSGTRAFPDPASLAKRNPMDSSKTAHGKYRATS